MKTVAASVKLICFRFMLQVLAFVSRKLLHLLELPDDHG